MTDPSPDTTPTVFDLPPDLVYLNCAGQAPRLLAALDAGARALRRSAQPWSESLDDWLARPERVRTLAAAVIDCDAEGLALVPSVAYGMALAAHCLPMKPGQIVLTLSGEHPSAINVWQVAAQRQHAELQQVQITDHGDWTVSLLAAINARVAVVVTPACHSHNGRRIDLARIARAARAHGAALVVDATQALGVLDLDLAALDADFVIAAGHKWLLGGAGLAYACIAERHRQAQPLEETAWARVGGLAGGIHDGQLPAYVAGAARFDGSGLYSHPALVTAEVGLAQLLEWHIANVRAQLQQWQRSLLSIFPAQGLADWRVIADSPHLMSFQPPGAGERICQEIVQRLLDQKLVAAARGDGIRISPYMHNSTEDATRLCVGLADAWLHVKR
ncbi:MAG: aminotransferase class V-fold PLP-dependent enzyme [Pseudomonadota bacterium]|nr:aminotransferase class V-fold PLP-dependent enzyme [Pseudomonadota bacterium]